MKARAFSSFLRDLSNVGQALEGEDVAQLLRELAAKLDSLRGNPSVAAVTKKVANADPEGLRCDAGKARQLIKILASVERLLIVAGKKSYVTDVAALRAALEARPDIAATELVSAILPPVTTVRRQSLVALRVGEFRLYAD